MRHCTIALALILSVTGCKPEVVREPYPVYIEVEKPLQLDPELLEPCPIAEATNRTVGEYVRVANTNTPALRICAKQIEGIRKVYGIEK